MSPTIIMEPDVQQKLAILGSEASDRGDRRAGDGLHPAGHHAGDRLYLQCQAGWRRNIAAVQGLAN
jgi:hypothetical protein